MNDIIIDDDAMTKEEIDYVNSNIIRNPHFPAYYSPATFTSQKYEFFAHILVSRNSSKVSSDYFYFFANILKRFAKKHHLSADTVTRGSINIALQNTKNLFVDPHVDNVIPHKVFILYLNDDLNDKNIFSKTIIFDREYDLENFEDTFEKNTFHSNQVIPITETNDEETLMKKLSVKKMISPKTGRAICFDGKYYHTACFPDAEEFRYVVVFNFF